jgi:hypothetical protein
VQNSSTRGLHAVKPVTTVAIRFSIFEPKLLIRVIDVGTEATPPRLFESGRKRANYITLSHCWGNTEQQPVQTTAKNPLQHYEGISLATFGQTFQDAILFTRELGIQFLWIDILCII